MAKPNSKSIINAADVPRLAELKALRKAQRDTSQKIEETKLRLFQISEQHMDQVINIVKQWVRL